MDEKQHKIISRCYLEITNICNLNCKFCPKTKRAKKYMDQAEFDLLTDRLKGRIKFLYFHLMGEPLLHPLLPAFVLSAKEKGFIPVITTNGTLLTENAARLLDAKPHKIQISIHSHEGNGGADPDGYIARVMNFSTDAAERGIIVVLRLWNQGGYERNNDRILELIARHVPRPWTERYDGWKISPNLYVEFDKMFEWPDEDHEEYAQEEVFCYALRNQIGVLADGTVVPCCLDHDGAVPLGNLFRQSLHDILSTPRAVSLLEGFSHHFAAEPFCRKCGYASVTKRFRK